MKKISVIIPVHNVDKYLEQCLDSVVEQTIFKDLEIICINDASTDNSLNILNEYSKKYENIKVINFEINKGVSVARNVGIVEASSEYIAFLDSDDFIEKEMYEEMYKKALEKGSDIVECEYYIYKEGNKSRVSLFEKDKYIREKIEEWKKYLLSSTHGGARLIKKNIILKYGISFPEGLYYEDNYFFNVLKLYSKNVSVIRKPYYYYRRENLNSTTLKKDNTRLFDRLITSIMLLQESQKINKELYNMEITEEIEFIFFQLYYRNTLWYLTNPKGFSKLYIDKINEIKQGIKNYTPNYKKNKYYLKWWNSLSIKSKFLFKLTEIYPQLIFNLLKLKNI